MQTEKHFIFLTILFLAPDRSGKRLTNSTHLLQYCSMTWWLVLASKSHSSLPPRSWGPAFVHHVHLWAKTDTQKQASKESARERDHCNLFLVLGILQHHAVAATKFGFIHTVKQLWAAPNTGQLNWHEIWQWHYQWKYQLEMAPGFLNVSAGGGNQGLHFWLFCACSNEQNEGTKHQDFASASTNPHIAAGYLGQWFEGLSLAKGLCHSTFPGFGAQGTPWRPPAEALRDRSGELHVNCLLPSSLVSRGTKEDK